MAARPTLPAAITALAVFGLGACFQHPEPGVVETAADQCIMCHQPEYEAAGLTPLGSVGCILPIAPVHVGAKPTTCADCHVNTAWCPALDGVHPEAAFPIRSGPHGFPCLDCHVPALGDSTGGMNVSCIGCHTGTHNMTKMNDKHREKPDYVWEPARPAFCRDCHPRGRN